MQRVSSEWAKRYSEGCDSAGVRDLALDLLDARAEIAAMRPVVEAAKEWRKLAYNDKPTNPVDDAVDVFAAWERDHAPR